MRTLGVRLIIVHGVFLLVAAILFAASFGAFLGETPMIASGVIALVVWGVFAGLTIYAMTLARKAARGDSASADSVVRWSGGLFITAIVLSVATGLLLAFGAFASCGPLYLSELYHWTGLVGSALAFVAFFVLPFIARAHFPESTPHGRAHSWWLPLVTAGPVCVVWGLVWIIAYAILNGTINESAYPPQSSSPFRLPWPAGESAWVIQGNSSGLNHNGGEQFAWDFRRRCGTPVLAARAGTVATVIDTNDGNGGSSANNMIEVNHADGTVSRYLHIRRGSASVRVGDAVTQGQELAKVGNVGNSLTGHIHFVVERGGTSIPMTFADVTDDRGIPRTFGSYTSRNPR